MKILFLGYTDSHLIDFLKDNGEEVIATDEKVDTSFIKKNEFDFLVSYGYRHIIRKDVLDLFLDKAINLHIAYLPWNKGADPNFWSALNGTPSGVTVHYLDEGVDTGDIIVREKVEFSTDDTMATSFDKLQKSIQKLFKDNWNNIKIGTAPRIKQNKNDGNHHFVKDMDPYKPLFKKGWDTPRSDIRNLKLSP